MRFERFLVVLAVLGGNAAAQTSDSPAQVVRSFYAEYQKLHFSGLPDKAAAQKLSAYWSPALQTAFTRAQEEQARCLKAHPDEKGPWVEGDMFSSTFEGFSTVNVEDPKPDKSLRQSIKVNFEYIENGQKHPWSDQVITIRQGNRWMIDDIRYGGKQAFGNGFGGSLRDSLKGKGC
jgi:hypothetical protein